ncbi:MAG: SUMF1/EgtB/PvdO family nonheme iron enzyme [Cyclobacteriaceae bacterium]
MRKLAPMLIICLFAHTGWSQENTERITGKVTDAQTRMPLSGATVAVRARGLELICNDAGEFQFTVPRDALSDSLEVSHLGYKTIRKRLADIRDGEDFMLADYSIELRVVTITSRNLTTKDIDRSLRVLRGPLYAFETETTNGLYNLFLTYLEEQSPELYRKCNYDLSSVEADDIPLFEEYVAPYRKPRNKRDTTARDYTAFPAVNISHEAAVIFCQWLTEQYNATPGKKLFSKVRFRLPTLKEWQIAALGYSKFQTWDVQENLVDVLVPDDSLQMTPQKGVRKTIAVGTDILYPWFGSYYYRRSPQNHKGCFLGNFKVTDPTRPCDLKLPGFDGWTMMAQTATYFPNDIGLYDVVGNVAEMIDEKGKACGGSWNDPPEKSTIHSIKSYRRPDPSIGFRVFVDVIED